MNYLFSESGLRDLHAYSSSDTLFAFDFDGTLAPITAQPENSTIQKEIRTLLEELTKSHRVAVISGRALGDLRTRIAPISCYLVGNHGIEGDAVSHHDRSALKSVCDSWGIQLSMLLHKFEQDPKIWLEDKTYSFSLHFRDAADPEKAASNLLAEMRKLSPSPRIIQGKYVLNLLPTYTAHKGTALLQLMLQTGTTRTIYVGDDVTDEDVFGMNLPNILGIRVGNEKVSAAQLCLKDQNEVLQLIEQLLNCTGKNKTAN